MKSKCSIRNINLPNVPRMTHTVRDDHYTGQGAMTYETRIPARQIEGYPPSEQNKENATKARKEEARRKREIVKKMAMQGKRGREIQEATGYTLETIRTMVRDMRRQGIVIPERKQGREKNERNDAEGSGNIVRAQLFPDGVRD